MTIIDGTKQRCVGVIVSRTRDGGSATGYPKTYIISDEDSVLQMTEEDYTTKVNAFLDTVESKELGLTIVRTSLIKES